MQAFAELECGGIAAFTSMIKQNLYCPYQWHVRFFKEQDPYEVHIVFTPQGEPYGYKIQLPESLGLPSLSQKVARELAQETLGDWEIDLDNFEEIEVSENKLPNQRVDHSFTFKRISPTLGTEGTYRIKVVVAGNRVIQVQHYVHVPESFIKKYEEMRSANSALSSGFRALFFILYLAVGSLLGSIILARTRRLITHPTLWIAVVVAALVTMNHINMFPVSLIQYQTTVPLATYYFQYAFHCFMTFIQTFGLLFLVLCAAEGLDRWAFGSHLQFTKLLEPRIAGSHSFNYQTVLAYLFLGIICGISTLLYYLFIHKLGWWAPASMLIDPSIVATYCPSLAPISQAMQAGILEEALFRAIPLAGSALIGRYFKREKLFLSIGIIFQALMFGGMHIDYPQLPAYFRIVEILPMSCIFAGIYLIFGLYPVMVIHVVYDLIFMSLSLFSSDGINMLPHKALVIIVGAVPLLVCIYYRITNKKYTEPASSDYNDGWKPLPIKKTSIETLEEVVDQPLSPKLKRLGFVCGAVALLLTSYMLMQYQACRTTLTLSAEDARSYAADVIEKLEVDDKNWTISTQALSSDAHTKAGEIYVWQNEGSATYKKLVGSYVPDTYWYVRYALFEGKPEERVEGYIIVINNDGNVVRVQHTYAESKAGATLSQPKARGIALEAIEKLYGLSLYNLKEISVVELDKPHRKDYIFTFQDTSIAFTNSKDQAHISITITGDTVSDYNRSIFTPEQWVRKESLRLTMFKTGSLIALLLLAMILLFSYGALLQKTLTTFSVRSFGAWFIPLTLLALLQFFNKIDLSTFYFSTAQPFQRQLFSLVITGVTFICIYQASIAAFISQLGTTIPIKVGNDSYLKIMSLGTFFGLIASAVIFVTDIFSTHYEPWFGKLLILSYQSELFGKTLEALFFMFLITLLLMIAGTYALQLHNKKRYLFITLFLMVGYVNVLFLVGVQSLPGCLVGALIGTIITSIFLYIFRVRTILIAIPASSIVTFFMIIREINLAPYGSIYFNSCIATVGVTLFSAWLFNHLWSKKHA